MQGIFRLKRSPALVVRIRASLFRVCECEFLHWILYRKLYTIMCGELYCSLIVSKLEYQSFRAYWFRETKAHTPLLSSLDTSIMNVNEEVFKKYYFNSFVCSGIGGIGVSTLATARASSFFVFLTPFRQVATPFDTLRMTLPAWTKAIWTSSMDGLTSISGMLN